MSTLNVTGVKRNQKLKPVQYRDMKKFDLNNFKTDLQNKT